MRENIPMILKRGNKEALKNRINFVLRTIAEWKRGVNKKLKSTKTPLRAAMKFKNLGTISKLMKNKRYQPFIRPTSRYTVNRTGFHILQTRLNHLGNPYIDVTHKVTRDPDTGVFIVHDLMSNRKMIFNKNTKSIVRRWKQYFPSN
jgi:hypothetical protein